jgi:hypothetical protein
MISVPVESREGYQGAILKKYDVVKKYQHRIKRPWGRRKSTGVLLI